MVKVVRLVAGDEIISDITVVNDKMTMKNPIKVVLTPNGIGFMQFLLVSSDKEFTIDMSQVLCIADVEAEAKNMYNQQTGGIVVPETKIVI